MGRVTKAQLEGVEADRDNLRDELAAVQRELDNVCVTADSRQAIINDLYRQQDSDASEIFRLEREITEQDEAAVLAIDALADAANETIDEGNDKIAFLVQSLISIVSYRGPQVNTVRGLAISALNDFVDPETLSDLAA